MHTSQYSTWLEIDLSAIRQNVTRLREIAGVPVMAIVKANAYGHGLVETSRAALQGGAARLGVARVEEALRLREGGITAPLLVLGYTPPERVCEAAYHDIHIAIFNLETAQAYEQFLAPAGLTVGVHLKIDTGMGRLGVFPEDGAAFATAIRQHPHLQIEGMFTHFALSDEPEHPETMKQIAHFDQVIAALEQQGQRPPVIHAANSAATLYFPTSRYDMVRCGIAIYGLLPSGKAPLPEGFRPALTWKARLSSVKELPPDHGVGYNFRYKTKTIERIGAVTAGYADGLRRRLGNFALVHGKRVDVVGGVCMDQHMLQLSEIPDAKIGDEVVIIGQQGNARITAEEFGDAWGTVNYDVVCGLAARLPRIYIDD